MYKDQIHSFRNKKGKRYNCYQDVLDESLGGLRKQAMSIVKELRAGGQDAFF